MKKTIITIILTLSSGYYYYHENRETVKEKKSEAEVVTLDATKEAHGKFQDKIDEMRKRIALALAQIKNKTGYKDE